MIINIYKRFYKILYNNYIIIYKAINNLYYNFIK